MQTLIKVLGIIVLVVIGIKVAFWVLHIAASLLFWALVVGVVLFVGSAAYAAVKGRSDRRALR